MVYKLQIRRDNSEYWNLVNPILSIGEPGFETDTNKLKIGNGEDRWVQLPYIDFDLDLSDYLTQSSASATYLDKDSASLTYITSDQVSETYITSSEAFDTFSTKNNAEFTGITKISSPQIVHTFVEKTLESNDLELSDFGNIVLINNASANFLNVLPSASSSFVVGSEITLIQTGIGQTTIQPIDDVAVNSSSGLKFRARYSTVTLIKTGSDEWVAIGDLTT